VKRRTYNNVLKATRLIAAKGYDHATASDIAIKCFDNMEQLNNGMSVEWFIDKIENISTK
jgi:hypothetical protein